MSKNIIKKVIQEMFDSILEKTENIDEERITNPESKEFVKNKQNFIGSHIFGDRYESDVNPKDYIYVAYSYNYDNPIFLYNKGKWYENDDSYIYKGEKIETTDVHRTDMRPTEQTKTISKAKMISFINKKKKKYGIKEEPHTPVTPGIKNE